MVQGRDHHQGRHQPGLRVRGHDGTGGNGVRMQWNYTGDTPGLPGTVSGASPRWLRLGGLALWATGALTIGALIFRFRDA